MTRSKGLLTIGMAIAVLASGCATAKFDPQQEVQIDRNFWGETYRQAGEALSREDLVEELEENPTAQMLLRGYRPLHYSSYAAGAVGGFMLGWTIGRAINGENVSAGLVVGGALLVGGAIILSNRAEKKLGNAVRKHNEGLNRRRKASFELYPGGVAIHF